MQLPGHNLTIILDVEALDATITVTSLLSDPYGIVRVPSLTVTKSFTACLLRNSTVNKIANTPGFYTPLPPLNAADVVCTKETSTMGLGLFATRSVKVKQVVFSEKPLLVFHGAFPCTASRPLQR
jgi:hypothetical protein